MRPVELSERERLFCERYVIHFVGTDAAKEAGYSAKSEKSLSNQASRLLARGGVQAKIKALTAACSQNNAGLKDRVIKALVDISFTSLTDLGSWDKDGVFKLKPQSEVSAAAQFAVQEISKGAAGFKIKLASRERTLEMLGRHIGLFDADSNGNLPKPLVIELLDGGKILLGAKQTKGSGT